jgi:phosphate transport system permease protein
MEGAHVTSLWRKTKDHGFTVLAAAATLLVLVPLVSVTWTVIEKGAPVISWSFLANKPTSLDDASSGVGPAIQGTLILVGLAVVMGVPVGVLSGAWLAEHGRNKIGATYRVLLDAMAATPSIVVGIVVFAVVVLVEHHYSAFAGGVALAFMIVAVVARTTEISLRAVPDSIREASVALGATHSRTLFRVTLPAASSGALTGAILATARVAGETAPLLFTAFNAQQWFSSLSKPIASMPIMAFNYFQQPYPIAQQQVWGLALILFVLVFGANVIVRVVSHARSRQP